MSIDATKQRAIIDEFIAAYSAFDIEAMLGLVHPEIILKDMIGNVANAEATGVEEFRAMVEQSKLMFSSRKQLVSNFKSRGDTATVDIEFTGVLAKDLLSGMKVGDTLQLTGRSEYQFREDKIYRIVDSS